MHESFFKFESSNHFDLGVQMGKEFAKQAIDAINANQDDISKNEATAKEMLKLSEIDFPEYVEELRGYAQGAEVDFLSLWTLSLEDDAFINQENTSGKCTTIVTKNAKLIGHSEDTVGENHEHSLCVVSKKIRNLTTTELFYYNTLGGSSIGFNSHGNVHAVNTLHWTPKRIGVPKSMAARMFLDTVDLNKTISKLKATRWAHGFSHNFIDAHGKLTSIEVTTERIEIVTPNTPFCHSNHCLYITTPQPSDKGGTFSRLEMANQNASKLNDISDMAKLLEDKSLGEEASISNRRTIGRMIVNRVEKLAYIWLLREAEKMWVKYPIK